jgi:hypothetical protein
MPMLLLFSFAISDVSAWPKTGPCPAPVRETNEKLYIDGELSDMGVYDYTATVQVTVTNTGEVDGAEVAQVSCQCSAESFALSSSLADSRSSRLSCTSRTRTALRARCRSSRSAASPSRT